MSNRIVRAIANIPAAIAEVFSPLSVDRVVGRMNADLARLRAIAENRRIHAQLHVEAADDLLKLAREHSAESERALRVADRLAALVA